MSFAPYTPPAALRAPMGNWMVTILDSGGARLTAGTHFHVDEGPTTPCR